MRWRSRRSNSIRPPGSRLLHAIDDVTARPAVAWILLLTDGLWVLFSIVTGFPARLETIFQTLVAASTLALVFVIQHTQAREQLVVQRKLDELLQAASRAANTLIGLEEASDEAVAAAHAGHRGLRNAALDGQ
jgi:low affinity Fe/Cu permease